MVRIASTPAPKPTPAWHEPFLRMLPAIRRHARIAFRHLDPEAREEAIQCVVCNACSAIARLAELGKLDVAYATVLARFGVAQVKDGRMTGGHLNCKDVLSPYCRRLKSVTVERLDKFDCTENEWQEILIEDRHAGPFDIVRTKLDFAAWLRSLPGKLRRIAKTLANGERTGDVARKFGLSDGRISQIRSELYASWRAFIGEPPSPAVAVA
jgi:hypothetical protein